MGEPTVRPERSRLLRQLRSPSTILAIFALLFAMAGGAVAKDKIDKDEVTVVTTTGEVTTTAPGLYTIPLTDPTFTQKAGEVALISAEVEMEPENFSDCDVRVVVAGIAPLGLEMPMLTSRGDVGDPGASQALAAPEADREITLTAEASVEEFEEAGPPDGQCKDGGDPVSFTVSLRVSISTLRN